MSNRMPMKIVLWLFSFQGDSEFDVTQWTVAIETAIQTGLGDKRVCICLYFVM